MKKHLLSLVIAAIFFTTAQAQVAIKPAGSSTNSDPSAMLDVQSTNKGALLPRMTATQRLAIINPATGLMVYDTDSSAFMLKNASGWVKLQSTSDAAWVKNGNDIYSTINGKVGINMGSTPLTGFGSSLNVLSGNNVDGITVISSNQNNARAIKASSNANQGIGVSVGVAGTNGTGVIATANGVSSTGVQGWADSSSSTGVYGKSSKGTAGAFFTTSGFGLQVDGGTTGQAILVHRGNTGLGVTFPKQMLEIAGAVKLADTATTATATDGTIRYNATQGFQGKHSNNWQNLGGGNNNTSFTTNGNHTYQTNIDSGTVSIGGNASLPTFKTSVYSDAQNPNGIYVSANSGNGIAMTTTGRVGINTLTPYSDAVLDVNGNMYIRGGNPGAGKVLTSNADGKTSWQTPSGGVSYSAGTGINISGSNVISTIPQTLSINSNQLTLSNNGGTVNLPTYSSGTGIVVAGTSINALHTSDIWNANKLRGNNVSTTTPTIGQVLTFDGTDWTPAAPTSGGGGSSQWTTNGNDINNNNTGNVLVGSATGTTGAKFETANNSAFGKVASFYNAGAGYMTIVDVAETGTSGNPMACVGCGGSAAIKSTSVYGDALFANSTNGRGIFLKGGSSFYPAMKIENNATATTSLEMDGQIKINGGTPGVGKVLTSDANGLATWQTPSGGSGGSSSGWGFSGNSGNSNTNFIGNTDAVDFIIKTNNTEAARFTSGGALLVTGSTTNGTTPTSGAGTRMMWIPNRAAFRAGVVTGTHWNDANIGTNSAAFGQNCIASGFNSFASGTSTSAGGNSAVAFGNTASASGANSVAMGYNVSASQTGSMCFGDQDFLNTMSASTSNEMSMRFKGGYRLFTTSATSGGSAIAALFPAGASSWSYISDKRRKENFVPVNGEEFLNKISEFNLTSWNYKGQNAETFRHYGPMAQDFYKAFGKDKLGTIGNDTTIASADFDGINFIAIQALEKRTTDLNKTNEKLQQENKKLQESLDKVKAEMATQKEEMMNRLEMLEKLMTNQNATTKK